MSGFWDWGGWWVWDLSMTVMRELKPMNWCKTRKKQREHDNDWNTLGALVWLWNKHLGFLPFTLFDINDLVFIVQWVVVSFHFDVCQFVKSTIMPFSFPILIKVMPLLILFSLMFWCPATISSISSNIWSVSFSDGCTWVAWLFLMKDNVKSISIVCPVLPYDLDTIWEANQVFMISWNVKSFCWMLKLFWELRTICEQIVWKPTIFTWIEHSSGLVLTCADLYMKICKCTVCYTILQKCKGNRKG